MSQAPRVSLQINVAPTDLPHAVWTLPHQLRQWAGQVHEILFTLDLHRTVRGGRFGEGWQERRQPFVELLDRLCQQYPGAHVCIVDYGIEKMREVATTFLGTGDMPPKDTKGAPFYPYFYGLHTARHDLVLHLDSDMMFGGGSQSWMAEAVDLLERNPGVLACSPLPGPPMAEQTLRSQAAIPFRHTSVAFRFARLSTRIFLIDRRRMRERLLPLTLQGPVRLLSHVKSSLHGNPPYRAAELVISEGMVRPGLTRVDFLGAPPGMWSLHAPFRSTAFYQALPRLIERVEGGDIPDGQRGDHDLNDSMLNMAAARRRARLRRLWA